MKEIIGKAGISAKVICDSISEAGVRLITYEITYPRLVLSEVNTHRMLSKNSASSRAIPFAKMKEQLTGKPVRFGQANPGMQDKGEDYDGVVAHPRDKTILMTPQEAWEKAKEDAVGWSEAYYNAGFHKQVFNRLSETFQMMKTVLTGTELENYFWLRNHDAADPSISELARCMWEAREDSKPRLLKAGEWHLPYITTYRHNDEIVYYILDEKNHKVELFLEDAIKVSCARSAAVSFRNTDYGVEKSREVFERLVGDDRKHGSATEHVATPLASEFDGEFPYGATHKDRNGDFWSGNFMGWLQYRQTIKGHNYARKVIDVGSA